MCSFPWKLDLWVRSHCHKVGLAFDVTGAAPENRCLMTSLTSPCFPATLEFLIWIFPNNNVMKKEP